MIKRTAAAKVKKSPGIAAPAAIVDDEVVRGYECIIVSMSVDVSQREKLTV